MKRQLSNIFIVLILMTFMLVGGLERCFHPHLKVSSKEKEFFQDDVFTNRLVPFLPFSSFPMFSDRFDQGKVSDLFVVGLKKDGTIQKVRLELYTPFWDRGYQLSLQNAVLSGRKIEDHVELLFQHIQNSRKEKYRELRVVYGVYDFDSWVKTKEGGRTIALEGGKVLYRKEY